MNKPLRIFGITIKNNKWSGLLDPDQLKGFQIYELDIRDLDTPLICEGEYSRYFNKHGEEVLEVESIYVNGPLGLNDPKFVEILDEDTFSHLATKIHNMVENDDTCPLFKE